MFAFIADAFSFIGFRRTQVADFRCYRANFFLIRTAHNNLVRSRYVKGDAGRRLFNNRMGETQCEVNVVSRRYVVGTAERPRLNVYRSLSNIYAQVINDETGETIAAASTVEKTFENYGGNVEAAKAVGKAIAEKAMAKGVKEVVFDRGGYLYHGRIAALAEAAREAGLQF